LISKGIGYVGAYGSNAVPAMVAGDVAQHLQRAILAKQARGEISQSEAQRQAAVWGEGGIGKLALHVAAAGVMASGYGGGSGYDNGVTASSSSQVLQTMSGVMAAQVVSLFGKEIGERLGLNEELTAQLTSQASLLTQYAIAGDAGYQNQQALNQWNRELHKDEIAYIEKLAKQYAKEKGISVNEAKAYLMIAAYTIVDGVFQENEKLMSSERRKEIESARLYLRKYEHTAVKKESEFLQRSKDLLEEDRQESNLDRKWVSDFNDQLKAIFYSGKKAITYETIDAQGNKVVKTIYGYATDVDWLKLNFTQSSQNEKNYCYYGHCLAEAQYFTKDQTLVKVSLTCHT
jgi:hypothetical protein